MMSFQQVVFVSYLSFVLLQGGTCSSGTANKKANKQSTTNSASVEQKKGDEMDLLIQRVLSKDPSTTLLAKRIGPSATPSLKPLATHADPVVREIALRCIDQSGGADVAGIFVAALDDKSASVRTAALTGLQNHLEESVYPQLLQAYDKSEDGITRQQIALLIGRLKSAQVSDLQPKYTAEKDKQAQEGCIAALAKMGDKNSQSEFVKQLQAAKDRDLKRYLDYVDYIHQTWVLKHLLPVLRDKSPILRVGADGLQGMGPEYLRACDIAVNLVAKIAGVKFSFPVNQSTNYTDTQLEEARLAVANLP
jgi:HEAT repeat protein